MSLDNVIEREEINNNSILPKKSRLNILKDPLKSFTRLAVFTVLTGVGLEASQDMETLNYAFTISSDTSKFIQTAAVGITAGCSIPLIIEKKPTMYFKKKNLALGALGCLGGEYLGYQFAQAQIYLGEAIYNFF